MRESELIDRLESLFPVRGARVVRGIGDDAAVIRGGGYAVISVDAMIDGIHFRSAQLSPQEIGHRALAGALSDLAAMGSRPAEAYLVLGLPPGIEPEAALGLAEATQELAGRHEVTVAGGDITESPCLMVSLTVVGWAADPGALVGRDGARPGDLVALTGSVGGAGAGLALLDSPSAQGALPAAVAEALRERYARPQPRLAEGQLLAQLGASAMIDVSDGVAHDAALIGRRSRVRLELSLASLPLAEGVEQVAAEIGVDHRSFAATAGDDYELCVCVPPAAAHRLQAAWSTANASVTWVGTVTEGQPGVAFIDAERDLGGYEHSF